MPPEIQTELGIMSMIMLGLILLSLKHERLMWTILYIFAGCALALALASILNHYAMTGELAIGWGG